MTGPTEKVLEQLPVFPDVTPDGEWRSLRVEGLVATRLDLGQGDLTALGRFLHYPFMEGRAVDQLGQHLPASG